MELEKKLQEMSPKKIVPAEQTKKIKPIATRQQPNSSAPITPKDSRFAIKTLMQQHKSKEQWDLFDKLIEICNDINHRRLEKDIVTGPYLQRKHHVLFGTINHNFRYIYYPCTRKISIHRTPFNELLANISKFMEKEKTCSNACRTYYESEESSRDHSSHSSDMDTSSDHDIYLANIK